VSWPSTRSRQPSSLVALSEAPNQATEAERFRAQFPVFERLHYLNAGTEGPVPAAAVEAVKARLDADATGGRCGRAYIDRVLDQAAHLRAGYARVLGCAPSEVALTGSTTDGVNTVLGGLEWTAGDEVVTSDEEHPGLLAPLGRLRRRFGVEVRVVPFAELAGAVGASTRLVACSHVSWVSGRVADTAALAATGVPVLLDGAQGLGAVPVDVGELGCTFYAGSGQKWLCGPEGSGALYVDGERLDDLLIPWPGYGSLSDAERALDLLPADGAARLDHGFPVAVRTAHALASLEVFERAGWDWVHRRASTLAELLATRLSERGLEVWPRGNSTLVSWEAPDAPAEVERLAGEGVVVRSIPSHGLVRASVGAWCTEDEVELLASLAAGD
jgi:selenocysteine lyase/cysteine desulfurase